MPIIEVERYRGPREPWRYLVRAAVSIVVLAALAVTTLCGLILAGLRCDDVCSGDEAEWWGWDAAMVLAMAGGAIGVVAIVLGFTKWAQVYSGVGLLALACVLGWIALLGGSG